VAMVPAVLPEAADAVRSLARRVRRR
jgi:hypothetical protein